MKDLFDYSPMADDIDFIRALHPRYARKVLRESGVLLREGAEPLGQSASARSHNLFIHNLFITVEGMTPAEYGGGGETLAINYSFAPTLFGDVLIATTPKGVCSLEFADNPEEALAALRRKFPRARYCHASDAFQQKALAAFTADEGALETITLHLKGTEFQLKVWEFLLKIPKGALTSYGEIALLLGRSGASRAVGSAVAANPVAYLIPCHRVILSSGEIGHYHWGEARKSTLICRELNRAASDSWRSRNPLSGADGDWPATVGEASASPQES